MCRRAKRAASLSNGAGVSWSDADHFQLVVGQTRMPSIDHEHRLAEFRSDRRAARHEHAVAARPFAGEAFIVEPQAIGRRPGGHVKRRCDQFVEHDDRRRRCCRRNDGGPPLSPLSLRPLHAVDCVDRTPILLGDFRLGRRKEVRRCQRRSTAARPATTAAPMPPISSMRLSCHHGATACLATLAGSGAGRGDVEQLLQLRFVPPLGAGVHRLFDRRRYSSCRSRWRRSSRSRAGRGAGRASGRWPWAARPACAAGGFVPTIDFAGFSGVSGLADRQFHLARASFCSQHRAEQPIFILLHLRLSPLDAARAARFERRHDFAHRLIAILRRSSRPSSRRPRRAASARLCATAHSDGIGCSRWASMRAISESPP